MPTTEKNEKAAEKVGVAYKTTEKVVAGVCKATETSAVNGFNKVSDKFTKKFFTKDGGNVEEVKKCLAASTKKSKIRSKDINGRAKSHKYQIALANKKDKT